jgi:hypothetical protein
MPGKSKSVVPIEQIDGMIHTIRGVRVMLDRDLARKIEALEKKYDEKFAVVFEAIKQLITPPEPPKRRIGFHKS